MDKFKIRRGDILLISALLLIGIILVLWLFLSEKEGAAVQVRVDGEIVASYPLNKDGQYTVAGVHGGTNRLVIQDGQAWVEAASCPDGLCMGMGKISRDSQSIVCLPNKVVVEVVDRKFTSEAEVDLITGGRP